MRDVRQHRLDDEARAQQLDTGGLGVVRVLDWKSGRRNWVARARKITEKMEDQMKRVNDDELRRLWPTRLSDKEIASRLGHHRSVIRRRAENLGLKPRRIVWAEQDA